MCGVCLHIHIYHFLYIIHTNVRYNIIQSYQISIFAHYHHLDIIYNSYGATHADGMYDRTDGTDIQVDTPAQTYNVKLVGTGRQAMLMFDRARIEFGECLIGLYPLPALSVSASLCLSSLSLMGVKNHNNVIIPL